MLVMDALRWIVMRQDDNGIREEVGRFSTRSEAEVVATTFEARAHKQTWVDELADDSTQSDR
jgi:hypothetical protein